MLCSYLVAVCPLGSSGSSSTYLSPGACLCGDSLSSAVRVRASQGVSDKEGTVEKPSGVRRGADESAAPRDAHVGTDSTSAVEILPKSKGRWREMFLIRDVHLISSTLCFGIF